MYNVIAIIIGVAMDLFVGCCLLYYFSAFMEMRWNTRPVIGKGAVVIIYFMAANILSEVFSDKTGSTNTLWKIILLFLVILLIAKLFYNAENHNSLFLTITFVAMKDLCMYLAMLVSIWGGKLVDVWLLMLEEGYTSPDTFMNLVDITASVLQTLMTVVFGFLFWWSLKRIVTDYKEKDYKVSREESLFLLIPGFVGFLLCALMRTILVTMEDKVPQLLYDKYPILLIIVPAICILSLLSILYSVKLFQDMVAMNREKSNRIVLEKQVQSMQEHIEEMEHIYSGVRSMKHDMKNTVSVIMQLALKEGKANTELESYLHELNQTMDRLEFQYKTGNSVVDILLNMKYHEVSRMLPQIQIKADDLLFPENLHIQSYDLGIILGNALDNAIEACKKLREVNDNEKLYIKLSSFQKGKMFFVEVENSFDGKVVRKKHSDFPITNKSDKKEHGIGLVNIRNTAEKYHGGVDWTAENKVFTLTVMMQNDQKTGNI